MDIRQRRLDKGWSQEELARHSGLSTRTIQRIEGGQRAGLESLKCLAAVFETSISTLMQAQEVNAQNPPGKPQHPMINEIERQAIEFAQLIVKGPEKGGADPLSRIEREVVTHAKNSLRKLCK